MSVGWSETLSVAAATHTLHTLVHSPEGVQSAHAGVSRGISEPVVGTPETLATTASDSTANARFAIQTVHDLYVLL